MQALAGASHQALTLGLALILIPLKQIGQLPEQSLLVGGQGQRGQAQLSGQKRLKGFASALQVAEAPISL